MRTDVHFSVCTMLSLNLIHQMFKFSGHVVFQQNRNSTSYINVATVTRNINAFYVPKSYFPNNQATKYKLALQSCVIFVLSMVQTD